MEAEKTPTKPTENTQYEDGGKYRSCLNETAVTYKQSNPYLPQNQTTSKPMSTSASKPFEKAGIPAEEFDIETQRKLLEEIERKHKENQSQKSSITPRQVDYFKNEKINQTHQSVSHSDMRDMTRLDQAGQNRPRDVSDVLLDPPSIHEKAQDEPFSEFLDYDSDSDAEFDAHSKLK